MDVAIGQDQLLRGNARLEALMLPFFAFEIVAIGVPVEQIRNALALLRARLDFDGEASLNGSGDGALETAEIVEIGDDALAGPRRGGAAPCRPATCSAPDTGIPACPRS
jgi:hypothetical protein